MSRIKPFYESKYPVSSSQRIELMQMLQPAVIADQHGSNGCYEIFSLYFDTPDLQFYQDKLNGEFLKTKVRLRFYRNDENSGWSFPCLEIKQRRGNLVSKHRFKLEQRLVEEISVCASDVDIRMMILKMCSDAEIRRLMAGKCLLPAVAVYYCRTAFQFRGVEGLRLTFDREITGVLPGRLTGAKDVDIAARSRLQGAREIFEIKSYAQPPAAILQKLAGLNVAQQSFSKYAFALQAMHRQGLVRLP